MDNHYIIIATLIIIIIAYCIFAYPYVFNRIDVIQYKMAQKPSFITFDHKMAEDAKDALLRTFSNFTIFVENIKEQINDVARFVENVKRDFII